MSKILVVLGITSILACAAMGGTIGSIKGAVYDQVSGERLPGVNVVVDSVSKGASSDLDGKYKINGLEAGVYTLRISYIGYTRKTITDVVVKGDETLTLDIGMVEQLIVGDEVTVTAERVLSTEAASLAQRKNASTIGDGITMEQVKRTPDATSGDALKRVTGVAVVDDKYVYVRGITDRYNGTTLDGASVSGSEAGKKSFAFDLIPASLLENTNVVKSSTPDLPGDFTGGLIQMNTLDIPDRFVGKISISSSYNNVTTGQQVYRSQGGGKGWLGIDDGTRTLPDAGRDLTTLAQSLPNTWGASATRAPYNAGFSAVFGDDLPSGQDDPSGAQMGYIAALTYKNAFQRSEKERDDRIQSLQYKGMQDEYSVLWGGIANLTYKFGNGLNKISFKNNYNHTADDQVFRSSGVDNQFFQLNDVTIFDYSQRSVYNGQLIGDHTLPSLGNLALQWKASLSSAARQEPDRKEVFYQRSTDFPDQNARAGQNRRSWSTTNDRTFSGGLDATLPVGSSKVKIGGIAERKNSNYGDRYFAVPITPYSQVKDSIFQLPIDEVYAPGNFSAGRLQLQDVSNPKNNYDGEITLYAFYAMTDIPFEVLNTRFRFAGGARVETFTQTIVTPASRPGEQYNELKNVDILPSLNLTYLLNDRVNVRVAYSHSVNRPEFRERSNVIFEDFQEKITYGGNPNLQRAFVHNYDVRFEVFPAAGELLAVSFFKKSFSGAIEEAYLEAGGSNREVSFVNAPSADNLGWEFEVRKSLDFLGSYFSNLSVNINYTRVESRVSYQYQTTGAAGSADTRTVDATRPLYGQSPYAINVSIGFTEPTLGTSINIAYNKSGERLQRVGGKYDPDTYEQPRDMIDLAVNQPIAFGLEAKLTIKNLNNKPHVLTRNGLMYEQVSTGTTLGLQMSLAL